ncbi:Small subunit (SSU) processome component [Emydomyces testavorans]|uniref:Small subunit (SSU) processome component n=1 Tax=Emydomyces testavorans TaxID=2070801 RepID=A0AAF0DLW6_9EURO|nr:Small subunit (SSU) processome component [Emydomyces testavorans]
MPSKKRSRGPVSKISSAAAPASSGTQITANKSSVLRSAFSPSEYQLALFASVIQGLDAQHLRIHDINSGRLRCDHAVNPKEAITSLDWGYFGDSHADRDQHLKKKRKRSSDVNGVVDVSGPGDVVVAFGTSSSEVRMYSPAEGKIVGALSGGHERGIRDFRFTIQKPGAEGWSIGGDGKLVQWNLQTGNATRVISLPSTSVEALAPPVPSNPPVLCASQTPYLIDLEKEGQDGGLSFSAMRNTVHTLISSSNDLASLSERFLAADSDRYINLFDITKKKLLSSLVTDKEVELVAFYSADSKPRTKNSKISRSALFQKQLLAAVTRNGAIELFSNPFYHSSDSQSASATTSLKSRLKAATRRSDAIIKIVRPDALRTVVPIVSVSFDGSDLVIAWVEAGANVVFDRIRWQDDETEELIIRGESEIVRGKSASTIGSAMMNGVKDMGKSHVDESHVIVEQGGVADGLATYGAEQDTSISSDDEEEEGSDAEQEKLEEPPSAPKPANAADIDAEMADVDAEEEAEENGEPSFGELLRANVVKHIDVAAELHDTGIAALIPARQPKSLQQLPSGVSLATVLSQSLKTNDHNLLESCFHTTDVNIVRATIQRLDSSLAAMLLQKLAERLSSRPGRYGHLLVWVQWTCVAHGGSIAGKPEILNQMTSLFKVMDQRSASLSSLLLLKGKLDMLDAQLGLRQSLNQSREGRFESDDDNVIYVEGQEDEAESDEGKKTFAIEDAAAQRAPDVGMGDISAGEEEGNEDDMPMVVNGISSDSGEEDDDDEEDGDEDEELIDDEAEESEDGDERDVSEEDEDEDEDEEEVESMVDFIADSGEESEIAVDLQAATKKSNKQSNQSG